MTEKPATEEYVYYIGKIRFIVTPVYKETGANKISKCQYIADQGQRYGTDEL